MAYYKPVQKTNKLCNRNKPDGHSPKGSKENGELRQTGIEIIGNVPWGTHFCQFYQTKQDLIDTLVPYFSAGLESNEFCMWITAEPLGVEEATQALRESVPDLDYRLTKGQIEIIPHTAWYLKDGNFDQQRVLNGWTHKLDKALANGYAGLRLTGNTFWLEKDDWQDFTDYEEAVNSVIGDYRILAACTYSIDKCGAGEIADVVANHEFAMMKRKGKWTIIESTTIKQTKNDLKTAFDKMEQLNEELAANTEELEAMNEELLATEEELRSEIEERRRAERKLQKLNRTLKAHSKSDQAMVHATDEADYLRDVCKIIVEDCGHTMVWIGFAENDKNKTVRPIASAGFEEGYLETLNISWADTERGRGPTGTAIRTGKPSTCKNMLTDPKFEPWRDEAVKRGYASSLVLPLKTDGKTFGAVTIYSKEPDSFSEDEVKLLTELTNDLAYGITAIRLRTAHAQAEEALHESEERVRLKLESILSPEGDVGNLELADILDIQAIQLLMGNFYKLAHIPMAIINLKGDILVGIGWQDICTKFHRVHPETCKHCIESDLQLTAGVLPGESKLYKCKNNMWDIATPIMVGGEHVGNLFSGQFFFDDEPLDYELFRSQAKKYGFIEEDYIAALENVPRLSREAVDEGMAFFMKLADMLSQLSYSNIKLARSLSERDVLMDSLRKSEERLSRAQEIAHLGSWELDLINNHLSWSDEVYRIFGLQPQEFAATYEAFLDAVHPDDRAAVNDAYMGSLREGKSSYETEHRIIRKSTGETRCVHEKCEHFEDENGKIIRSVGMVLDITERKQAEEALRESEERYRSLFSSLLEGFCIIEVVFDTDDKPIDYRFLEINPAFENQTGLHEAQGKLMRELAPDHEAHWFELYGKIALTGEPTRFVNEAKALNRWFDVSAYRVGGQESRKVAILFNDITEQHMRELDLADAQAEAERRAAELEAFVSSMADGVVLFDTEPKVLMFNEAVMKIVGAPTDIPADEWLSQRELFTIEGEPVPREDYPSERALRGEETKDARFKMITPWNESVVGISGSPVRDMQGRVIGGALSFRDASKRVELEKYREDLYQRERHIAEVLQRALIPDVSYDILGCEVAVRYEAALKEAEVGGDFYDIFDLGDNKLGILIGDVAGKGLSAAIQVAAARHSVRSYAFIDPRPEKVMTLVNNSLSRDPQQGITMLTAFFAVVDLDLGVMTYANGGHETPVLRRSDGTIKELAVDGRAIGVMADYDYQDGGVILKPGDFITMVTDGITEARPNSSDLFGLERMKAFLSKKRRQSAKELADGLLETAKTHAGGILRDDAVVLVFGLQRKPK